MSWFAFLQHFDLTKLIGAVSQLDGGFLWQCAVTLYYTSWVFGTKLDASAQAPVFIRFPTRRWPIKALIMVVLLAGVAATLCWAEGDIKRFSAALLGFIFVDYANWRYLIRYLKPSVEESHYHHEKNHDFYAVERLDIVVDRVQGRWKWWRLSVGLPLAVFICCYAYFDVFRNLVWSAILWLNSDFPIDSEPDAVGGWLVLSWVLVVEIWIWLVRVKAAIQVQLLNKLEGDYALRRS